MIILLGMYSSYFDIFAMAPINLRKQIQALSPLMPRAPIRRITLTFFGVLLFGALPTQAYTIFSGIDPNGNPLLNLLPNIPNSTAAKNNFLEQLQGVGTETFESMVDGQAVPLDLVFPGAGTATLVGANAMIKSTPEGSTSGSGRYGTSPSHYLEVDGGIDFNIEFSQSVAAFGFFGVDIGDFSGTLNVNFNNPAIGLLSIPLAPINRADGSALFYGIIGDPGEEFSSVIFYTHGAADIFAFDDMTIGSPSQVIQNNPVVGVPSSRTVDFLSDDATVPGPLGVLGLGAGYGWCRRLRKRTRS